MKVSKLWLDKFFDAPLPDAQTLADALTFHAFEIDSIEQVEGSRTSLTSLTRSEEHTSELQSHVNLVCRLLLEKIFFLMVRRPPISTLFPNSALFDSLTFLAYEIDSGEKVEGSRASHTSLT